MKVIYAKYGDRWDLMAYDALGDSSLAVDLMAVNGKLIELDNQISEGTEVIIPDISTKENKITQIVAPWKL